MSLNALRLSPERIQPAGRVKEPFSALTAIQGVNNFFKSRGKELVKPSLLQRVTPIQGFLGNCVFGVRQMMGKGALSEAMGIFTGLNFFGGIFRCLETSRTRQMAQDQGDEVGKTTSLLGEMEGVTRVAGGGSYLANRIASCFCLAKGVRIHPFGSSLTGRVAAFSGAIGDGAFGVGFFLEAMSSAFGLGEVKRFAENFRSQTSEEEKIALLTQADKVAISDVLQEAKRKWSELSGKEQQEAISQFKEELRETALSTLARNFADSKTSSSKAYETYEKLFDHDIQGLSVENEWRKNLLSLMGIEAKELKGFSVIELLGLLEKGYQARALGQTVRERILGKECVKEIKKIQTLALVQRLKSANTRVRQAARVEYDALMSKVNRAMIKRGIFLSVDLSSSLFILGISVFSLLSLFSLCAAPPLYLTILVFIFAVVMNTSSLKEMLTKESEGGKWDRIYLAIVTGFVLLSFGATVGLVLGLKLAASELIKPALIAGGTLLLSGFALYRMEATKAEYKRNHPDLQTFIEELKKSPEGTVSEEMDKLFKKLPKEERLAIRAKLSSTAVLPTEQSDATEWKKFQRGVKKAVKRFWQEYDLKQTRDNYERAVKLQALLELLKEGKQREVIQEYNKLEAPLQGAALRGFRDVAARLESKEKLLAASQALLDENKKQVRSNDT